MPSILFTSRAQNYGNFNIRNKSIIKKNGYRNRINCLPHNAHRKRMNPAQNQITCILCAV